MDKPSNVLFLDNCLRNTKSNQVQSIEHLRCKCISGESAALLLSGTVHMYIINESANVSILI